MPMEKIRFKETGAEGVSTLEAYEQVWKDLGWELVGEEVLTANELPGETHVAAADVAQLSIEYGEVDHYGKRLEQINKDELFDLAAEELTEEQVDALGESPRKDALVQAIRANFLAQQQSNDGGN